jgi:hypothetical protein
MNPTKKSGQENQSVFCQVWLRPFFLAGHVYRYMRRARSRSDHLGGIGPSYRSVATIALAKRRR